MSNRFYGLLFATLAISGAAHGKNPIITDVFTADPAPLVHEDTVYLYVGQDEAKPDQHYVLKHWLVFSSQDMVHWQNHGSPLSTADFKWAERDAWAGHAIESEGKFYWYVPMQMPGGKAIGVAVGDSPLGPFKDARGTPLVENHMTKATNISWDDIDPAAFIDDDGQPWLFWGNRKCYYAKLKPNMIELDGPIQIIPDEQLGAFEEAPWVHKRDGIYYLSYASGFPEKTAYATAAKITGPWMPRGLLAEGAGNSNTIHQGIISFKGKDYFFYHTGMMQRPMAGGSFRRAVCIDYLYYEADGSMKRVIQTAEGVDSADK